MSTGGSTACSIAHAVAYGRTIAAPTEACVSKKYPVIRLAAQRTYPVGFWDARNLGEPNWNGTTQQAYSRPPSIHRGELLKKLLSDPLIDAGNLPSSYS
jgi:hypothetical protein